MACYDSIYIPDFLGSNFLLKRICGLYVNILHPYIRNAFSSLLSSGFYYYEGQPFLFFCWGLRYIYFKVFNVSQNTYLSWIKLNKIVCLISSPLTAYRNARDFHILNYSQPVYCAHCFLVTFNGFCIFYIYQNNPSSNLNTLLYLAKISKIYFCFILGQCLVLLSLFLGLHSGLTLNRLRGLMGSQRWRWVGWVQSKQLTSILSLQSYETKWNANGKNS